MRFCKNYSEIKQKDMYYLSLKNVIDIVSTVNIIFDVSSPDEQQLCAADANQDGIINVIDIVTIVNYI